MSDEWIKTLADRRRVKFTNQELDERAFLTAQVAGNKVVYSIVLTDAKNPLRNHARTSSQLWLDSVVPVGQSFVALQSE